MSSILDYSGDISTKLSKYSQFKEILQRGIKNHPTEIYTTAFFLLECFGNKLLGIKTEKAYYRQAV